MMAADDEVNRDRRENQAEIRDRHGETETPFRAAERRGEAAAEHAAKAAEDGFEVQRRNAQRASDNAQRAADKFGENVKHMGENAKHMGEQMADKQKHAVHVTQEATERLGGGLQELGRLWASYAQQNLRHTLELTKALTRCRTMNELIEVQTNFLRDRLDDFVQQSQKFSQVTHKVTHDAIQPIVDLSHERPPTPAH